MNVRLTRRTLVAALAIALCATACSGTTEPTATTQPTASPDTATSTPTETPPEPLLDIPSGMTWQELINEIASEDELDCLDDLLGDELPDELADLSVVGVDYLTVSWPLITTELIGIEIGDNRWPHELWHCMSPPTAAAIHLSVFVQELNAFLQEQQLTQVFAIDTDSAACIAALPQNDDFATTAAHVLGGEASFDDDDISEFMEELDNLAIELIVPCIPDFVEQALAQALRAALGDAVTDDELDCITDAAITEARSTGVDLSELLFEDSLSEAESERRFERLLLQTIETCLPEDTSSAPDDGTLADEAVTAAIRAEIGMLLSGGELDCAAEVMLEASGAQQVDLAPIGAEGWGYEDPLAELILLALAVCVADAGTDTPGHAIAISGREVYLALEHDGHLELTQLTDDGGWHSSASWSPDGTRLVYSSDVDGDSEIYLINADGSGLKQLTDDTFNDLHPSWSPDGTRIAFQSDRAAGGGHELFLMNADGSDIVRLTNSLRDIDGYWPVAPSWSPDGSRIVFNDASGIFSMAADGSDRRQITRGDAHSGAAWSPVGTRIAYSFFDDSAEGIAVVDAEGSDLRQVTAGPHRYPAWSPDGARLAFVDDEQHVLISNADGSDIRRLGTQPLGLWPTWSPVPYAQQELALELRHTFARDMSDAELDCITDTALKRFRAHGLDVGALLNVGSDDAEYFERLDLLLQLVAWPAWDACAATGS